MTPLVNGGFGRFLAGRTPKDPDGLVNDVEIGLGQSAQQTAKLASVELTEPLHELDPGRRERDDDLSPVQRIVCADDKVLFDELLDQPAGGGPRDPQARNERGHVQRSRDAVMEHLYLGHRDPDLGEVRGIVGDQDLHEVLEGQDHALDGDRHGPSGRGRPVCCGNIRLE